MLYLAQLLKVSLLLSIGICGFTDLFATIRKMHHLREVNRQFSAVSHSYLSSFYAFSIDQIFIFLNLSVCKVPYWEYVLSACAGSEINGTNCVLKSKPVPHCLGHKNALWFSALHPRTLVKTDFLGFFFAMTTIFVSAFFSSSSKQIRTMLTNPSYLFTMTTRLHLYSPTTTRPSCCFFLSLVQAIKSPLG